MARTRLSEDELRSRSFERILLIKPSSLGDVVHALPVLHGLRRRYPRAAIHWLISTSLASMLEGHPDIDELIRFDRRRYGRILRSPAAGREFLAFLRGLRAARYDLVLDLQGLFRTGFFAWATRSPVRIGPRDAREGAAWFYTHRTPQSVEDTHAVDRNLAVLGLLGIETLPEFRLPFTDPVCEQAASLLMPAGDRPIVAVVPGARWETKRWPALRFTEVIDALQASGEARCVLLGGPDERELCHAVAAPCATKPLDLSGRTNLPLMSAILLQASVVLCQDSGPMHIAVALGRPVVCLIGPTNPRRTGPYRRPDAVVRVHVECSPCYLKRLSQCPHRHRCMTDLDSARVVEAVRAKLRTRGGP